MFKSTSTSLILLGILAVAIGVIAIAWPGVTILALVILFAVYAFLDAGLQAGRRPAPSAGPVRPADVDAAARSLRAPQDTGASRPGASGRG